MVLLCLCVCKCYASYMLFGFNVHFLIEQKASTHLFEIFHLVAQISFSLLPLYFLLNPLCTLKMLRTSKESIQLLTVGDRNTKVNAQIKSQVAELLLGDKWLAMTVCKLAAGPHITDIKFLQFHILSHLFLKRRTFSFKQL